MLQALRLSIATLALTLSLAAAGQKPAEKMAQPAAPIQAQPKPSPWLNLFNALQAKQALSLASVPDLARMTENQASLALEKADLKAKFLNQPADADWRVAAQSLPANDRTKRGTVVNVTMGPPVPALQGKTLDEASQLLLSVGLQLGSRTEQGSPSSMPQIVRQDPAADTYAVPGSGVEVWLPPLAATTPQGGADQPLPPLRNTVSMPDLRTMTYREALLGLKRVDVRALFAGGRHAGTVQSQSIPPQTEVYKNSSVTLTFGIEVPDVEGLSLTDADEQLQKVGLKALHAGVQSGIPGTTMTVAAQEPSAHAVAITDLNVTLAVRLAPRWGWLATGLVVLLAAGLIVKKWITPRPKVDFVPSARAETPVLKIRNAPQVKFELRSKRSPGTWIILRKPEVQLSKQEAKQGGT